MHIGDVGIEEPMWVYLGFMRRTQREQWLSSIPLAFREITGLILTSPVPLRSPVAQTIAESGVLSVRVGTTYLLEIEFDCNRRQEHVDFRRTFRSSFNCDRAGKADRTMTSAAYRGRITSLTGQSLPNLRVSKILRVAGPIWRYPSPTRRSRGRTRMRALRWRPRQRTMNSRS
jgi:hypothetical protein